MNSHFRLFTKAPVSSPGSPTEEILPPVLVKSLTFLVRKRYRNGCSSLRRYARDCNSFHCFCTQVYANARLSPLKTWRHRSGMFIHVLRLRGESMDPELSEGARLLVGTARRVPANGEMFVLWDRSGLWSSASSTPTTAARPRCELKSANPNYATTRSWLAKSTSSARCCGSSGGCEGRRETNRQ